MTDTLFINEIFHSIQGESSWSGSPCIFIRLTGCNLRCRYCDTEYAFHEGKKISIVDIMHEVGKYSTKLVEVTGGEPLLQPAVHKLMTRLCDSGKQVLLETSGNCDISKCDPRVIRIMDIKTPGSGEELSNRWENIEYLHKQDEVKFVITDRTDYDWSCEIVSKYDLAEKVNTVIFSGVAAQVPGKEITGQCGLSLAELAQWILEDEIPVRLQTQLHKIIWDPNKRGV